MTYFRTLLAGAATLALTAGIALAETPVIKAAVLQSGTVNWELDTILNHDFDGAHGFELEVMGVAGGDAAQIALLAGEVDTIVSDWLWVARQRANGEDFVFIPYSKAVGGVLVAGDSTATSLADLRGGKIGIAGGPLDKSWLILRAYAQNQSGFDLKEETEQVFGAPPLIAETAIAGDVDGAINFWHFAAKMKAAGMRELVSVDEAARALGLDPETPLLGYVVRGSMVAEHPELVAALAEASRDAKALLASDPAAWEPLRERMRAGNEAEFEELKAGFIAGIPAQGAVDVAAAAKMMAVMIDLGGDELVGDMDALPDGVFWTGR